jgi:hypothetical protein
MVLANENLVPGPPRFCGTSGALGVPVALIEMLAAAGDPRSPVLRSIARPPAEGGTPTPGRPAKGLAHNGTGAPGETGAPETRPELPRQEPARARYSPAPASAGVASLTSFQKTIRTTRVRIPRSSTVEESRWLSEP